MDPFLNFPDDKLYELCEGLSNEDLNRFARTSKTIQSTCQREINKRLEIFNRKVDEEMAEIKAEMDKVTIIVNGAPILKNYALLYKQRFDRDPIGKTSHEVLIERFQGNYRITQRDISGSGLFKSPWILGDLKSPIKKDEYKAEDLSFFTRVAILKNDSELRKAVENIVRLGYYLG